MPVMDGEELTRIVKERYPDIEIIVLSSFGEFDYVRSSFQNGAIDYILKPKLNAQELIKVLRTAASRIPAVQAIGRKLDANRSVGQILSRLLSGYEESCGPEWISEVFPYSHYSLLGVDLKFHPARSEADFPRQMKETIEAAFQHHMRQAISHVINLDQHRHVVLINANRDDMTNVVNVVNSLTTSHPDAGFAQSEDFTDFAQLRSIYKDSLLRLLQYRFYFPEHALLMKRDLPETAPNMESFNLEWMTEEMKRGRFDAAFQYLQDHVAALSKAYTTDMFEYKAFLNNIIFNITIFLGNMKYEVKALENARYAFFRTIDEARTAGEAVQELNRFIAEAQACIYTSRNQPDNPNMKKLLDYIKEHYAEPLTLKDVAKHFHFNPSYLSSYFSTHNQEGFIEYLNKIRVEEAAKLLINGTQNISEISGLVGYSDHSYFCKVFKKIKGVSPSQYKRSQTLR